MSGLGVVRRLWSKSLAISFARSMPNLIHTTAASFKVDKSYLKDLKDRLTPDQYHVTQEKGTERPFTGVYNKHKDPGTYLCVVCNGVLFSSDSKFDSGCGWPAFSDVLDQSKVKLTPDTSHVGGNILTFILHPEMTRTEVTCQNCGSHLGHVFDDGPKPNGKRYCINSCSLNFEGKK